MQPPTDADFAALIDGVIQAGATGSGLPDSLEAQVLAAHGQGDAERFLADLQRLCRRLPDCAGAWWLLGLVLHDTQRHEEALQAMQGAAALQASPRHLLGLAQLCYETGRPAAAQFARLHASLPDDPQLVRNLSGALAAEGDRRSAERVLLEALGRQPDWREGLQLLATLRQTSGRADFDAGYSAAVQRAPGHAGLRMAWFTELAKARRWEDARRVLHNARTALGESAALTIARLYLDAESGAADHQADLFEGLPASSDPGLGLARVRHALRTGQTARAAQVAETFVQGPAAAMFWPYLSIAWRLLGDGRAQWLDDPDRLIQVTQLGLDDVQLAALADELRALHTMTAPYLEQSVRGGTQTDRPLLFHHSARIARLREAILAAVRDYLDRLPGHVPDHPLLAPARQRLRFAGSWSVRLRDQGFHACHTHPMGWISSACYVALPADMGLPPAGWLQLGAPPPELKLDLPAYRKIAPRPGQLVLFPSTMWHGTLPFPAGERLTVAFDLKASG